MGIQKEKILNSGISGNYWRILSININRQAFKASAQLGLFKDKAASDAGKPHIGAVKSFDFTFTSSDLASVNLISFVYGKILAIANQDISVDISGEPIDPPVKFDPDLVGGINI